MASQALRRPGRAVHDDRDRGAQQGLPGYGGQPEEYRAGKAHLYRRIFGAGPRCTRGGSIFYHMPTTEMASDGFTKPLPVAAIIAFWSRLGV